MVNYLTNRCQKLSIYGKQMLLYSPTLQGLESGECSAIPHMSVAKQNATFVRQNVSIPCPTDASKVNRFLKVHDVVDCGSL